MSDVPSKRLELIQRLFPAGIPRLWCPTVSHYSAQGEIDSFHLRAMIRSLAPHVGGLLVNSDIGDGWLLDRDISETVLDISLEEAQPMGMRVLYAVLEEEPQDAYGTIAYHLEALEQKHQKGNMIDNLCAAGMCGYAVCTPVGDDYTPEEAAAALKPILDLGAPIAYLYDPAITKVSLPMESLIEYIREYPNFISYIDFSGQDEYAQQEDPAQNFILLRGAEYDYSRWYQHYDGLIPPSANSFAPVLARLWAENEDENPQAADEISLRLTSTVRGLDELCAKDGESTASLPARLADHLRAYGKEAVDMEPPIGFDGEAFSSRMIEQAHEILSAESMLYEKGYLP